MKNNCAFTIRPSINIIGAGYDVLPITDEVVIKKMLAGAIPCRFITVGGLRAFKYTVPNEWLPNKVEVDKPVIEEVLRGR